MKELPITVRRSIELIGLFFLGWVLVIGKGILAPLMMAFFISIVLLPIFRFLRNKRFPEVLAIAISILTLLLLLGGIIWFFSSQISKLLADFPAIRENILNHLNALSKWINLKTHFSTDDQLKLINEQSNRLLNYAGNVLRGAAGSITSVIIFLGLLPIYTFLILFYKNLLVKFIFLWFSPSSQVHVHEALSEAEEIIKSYLIGLLIQVSYMTVLVGGALLLLGIKHALLIGVIFALLNLIPYVGALFGNIIGVLLTLASSQNLSPVFTVLGTIAAAQFLDNNILMPRIVGARVKINALVAIVGVVVGGAVAGVMGMFLSLPIIAVLKVIFDRTDSLSQWGYLFGDEKPPGNPMNSHLPQKQKREAKSQ